MVIWCFGFGRRSGVSGQLDVAAIRFAVMGLHWVFNHCIFLVLSEDYSAAW